MEKNENKAVVTYQETDIKRLLPIYKPNHVFIYEAYFDGKILTAKFRNFRYPYTSTFLNYLPGTYAVLFVSQAAYILGAAITQYTYTTNISFQEYIKLMLSEQIVFTAFNFRFNRFILNRKGLWIKIYCQKIKNLKKKLLIKMAFNICNRCNGTCLIFISQEHNIKH